MTAPSALVIQLGALGDVLRTTSILPALRHELGSTTRIAWVADPPAHPLLGWADVDRVVALDDGTASALRGERFDLVISLDKDPRALALAESVPAAERRGFGLGPGATVRAFSERERYLVRLGWDDEEKFRRNRKSFQRLIHDALGWSDRPAPGYAIRPDPAALAAGRALVDRWLGPAGWGGPRIGFATGSSRRFATKRWPERHWAELAGALGRANDARVLLTGTPEEDARNRRIARRAGGGVRVMRGPVAVTDFAGIVAALDLVVSGDTLAMHLALALGRPVVALFGPTCWQEIQMRDAAAAVVSAPDCAPCYLDACDHHTCMEILEPATVRAAAAGLLEPRPVFATL